ncbi:MAG TPA: ArsR family transcriptional regulator [Phycisphaerae bacterium]|nr:ArsR family transcriptional regulator [Phycisphaerales bacterium]HRX84034.1 ArsR family transcriptional regulator [Phycisphaerae bacterium]
MPEDALARTRNLFIRRWGEMGATWGISRTMAEIHALLFLTGDPYCTDDIMEHLQVSRGNASMNLRQLVNWGLIRRTHLRGDRKEYFVSDLDAWQMFETITRERRRREVEPIIETIDRCRQDLAAEMAALPPDKQEESRRYDEKLKDMIEFIHAVNALLDTVLTSGGGKIRKLTAVLMKVATSGKALSH